MPATSMTIRELTGSRRSVELRDRALPYRPVAFPGSVERKKTWYPGNPVATIQILGPRVGDVEMNGSWKARYIGAMATLTGFDDIWTDGDVVTPEILVEAFERIRKSCNQIELEWAGRVRRGILAEFEPNYERVEDIPWTMTFDWSQEGEQEAPRATAAEDTQSRIEAAMNEINSRAAEMPPIILPNITGPFLLAEQAMEQGLLGLSASTGAIFGIPFITNGEFQGVASFAEQAASAARDMFELMMDMSIEDFIATDTVSDILEAEAWRRAMAFAAREAEVVAIETREAIRQRVANDYLAIVTIREGQTLRTLAREWYGDADAWPTIADANGWTSSIVSPGTVVLIPRRSTPGEGARL